MAEGFVHDVETEKFDGTFVPVRRSTVADVELDGEGVLYDEESAALHILNPTALLLWRCFDGDICLDDLVAEISEAYGIDPGTVRADVLQTVRHLADEGLLEGFGAVSAQQSADAGRDAGADRASGPSFLPVPPST